MSLGERLIFFLKARMHGMCEQGKIVKFEMLLFILFPESFYNIKIYLRIY